MKVLQVVSDMNVAGAGKVVINLLNAAAQIPEVKPCFKVVIPKGSKLKEYITACGTEVIEASGIAGKSFSLRGVLEMLKIIIVENPDIVHTHAGLSARIASKILRKKTVFTRHWRGKADISAISRFFNNALCDAAFAVSQTAYDSLIKTGIRPDKILLLHNGIEPLKRDIEKKLLRKLNISGVIIGIAARLEEVKNHKLLLKAASVVLRERKDIFFLIAGEGSLESRLKSYASKLGISKNVIFMGFVSDMASFISAIDINIICSLEEAFPTSVLETMSLGVPTIATACGGTQEQIKSEVNGILVESADVNALAAAILRLASDSRLRSMLGCGAVETYKKNFGAEKFAFETIKLYKKLINNGGRL